MPRCGVAAHEPFATVDALVAHYERAYRISERLARILVEEDARHQFEQAIRRPL